MSTTIRNIVLAIVIVGLIAALVVVVLPFGSVFAAGADLSAIPASITSSDPALANAQLELAFYREKSIISRVGETINNFDLITGDRQMLIDRAKTKGKDVSNIQTAFDAFKTAVMTGKPFYLQANSILASQNGFDSNGKVIDVAKAKETVKSIRDVLVQYNNAVKTSRQSLLQAVRNFRLANPRKNATPAPTTNP